jgi:hypothetical protein
MKKDTKKKPELKSKTIKIKTNEENPEPLEIIAEAIIKCADAFDKIRDSKISERAIIVLIKDLTGLPVAQIRAVLIAGANLRAFIK